MPGRYFLLARLGAATQTLMTVARRTCLLQGFFWGPVVQPQTPLF